MMSLQQAEAKGSMISLHNAASNLGYSIGSGLGVILLISNWKTFGVILTILSLLAVATITVTVKLPVRAIGGTGEN